MHSFEEHNIHQVEAPGSPFIVEVLLINSKDQLRHCAHVSGSPRTHVPRLITESFKELGADRQYDSRKTVRRFLQNMEYPEGILPVSPA
jgi:hypothetical protein